VAYVRHRLPPLRGLVLRARSQAFTRRTADRCYVPGCSESSHSPLTIRRRLAAISVSHQLAGLETPTADARVKSVWAGIRRRRGVAPRRVRAARTKIITTLVAPLGNRLIDVRDRALILIGFAGALRRSEIVALDIEMSKRTPTDSFSVSVDQRPTRGRRRDPRPSVWIVSGNLPGTSLASLDQRLRH
jgi:integrase